MPLVQVSPATDDGTGAAPPPQQRHSFKVRQRSHTKGGGSAHMAELQQVYARDHATEVRGMLPESAWSRFLYGMLRAPVGLLLLAPTCLLLLLGLLFGQIAAGMDCHGGGGSSRAAAGWLDHTMLSFGSLVGNHFMSDRLAYEQPECTFLVGVEGYVGLVIQAVLFGALVNRVMTPPANQMELTDFAVKKVRDGQPWFSVAACHKFGRAVRDLECSAAWLKPTRSAEGEGFVRILPLEMSMAPLTGLLVPVTFSHILDETSPLHGVELLELPGLIMVRVKGYDAVVRAEVEVVTYYRKADITTAKRADMIDRDRFFMKVGEGERDGFNYSNFNAFK
jgi:hypothetical protein